jgi:hypothetical protein
MATAPAEPNGTSVEEALFRPSTRWRDSHRNRRGRLLEGFTEIELLPGLSLEDVRATRLTWDAFDSFAGENLVWMTPDVYVCNAYLHNRGDPLVLFLGANAGTTSMCVHVTPDTADAAATATCDFLVRLLATCEQDDLLIHGGDLGVSAPPSGAAITLFFQESRSCLRKVVLSCMVLSEDQYLALATMSRLDVEVTISYCNLADDVAAAATGAFVECLQSDRGPVNLEVCEIGSQILANALTGDSRVARLQPDFDEADDAEKAILLRALANNRGLVHLDLHSDPICDENWMILCESLQAHPTLTSLNLIDTRPRSPADDWRRPRSLMPDEQKAHRTRLLTEMMQHNTVLHTIELVASERDYQIYTQEIHPYLETNQYRPRVLAVKKSEDRPFRAKVLGRAAYSVSSNPNLVWMLLSENVDAFVRSEEE